MEGIKENNHKSFYWIDRNKMTAIFRSYAIPMETVNAIMMLYMNTKSMVHFPDRDTDLFNIEI